MQAFTGGVLVAAVLLVLAGVPKIVHPTPTVAALRAVGAAFATRPQVRLLAVAEVAIGTWAILRGGVLVDLLVAALYIGFSVFLVLALRPTAIGATCGCTGRPDTPPTHAHLALTVLLAVLSMLAAVGGGHTGLSDITWQDDAGIASLVVGLSMIGAWFGWVVLHDLADLTRVRTRTAER